MDYLANLRSDVQQWMEDDLLDLDDCLAGIIRRAELRLWRATKGAIGYRKTDSGTLSQELIGQNIIPPDRPFIVRGLSIRPTGSTKFSQLSAKDDTYVNELARTLASSNPQYYSVSSRDADNMIMLVAPRPALPTTYQLEYTTLNSVVDHPMGTWLAENAYDLLFAAVRLEAMMFVKASPDDIKLEKAKYDLSLEKFKIQHPARMRSSTYRISESR